MKRLFKTDKWKISEDTVHTEDFRLAESMMSLGNGYMGMRGNFEETYSGDFHQGSYIAGVWFPDKTRVGWWKNGYPEYFGKVINSTNYIGVKVFVDGEEVDLFRNKVIDYYRELDMKHGVLTRRFTIVHEDKETDFEVTRFLSIAKKQLGVIEYKATAINHDSTITFIPYLNGDVRNEDSNYEEDFWDEIGRCADNFQGYLVMKTKDNPFKTPTFQVATTMKIVADGDVNEVTTMEKEEYVENSIQLKVKKGETVSLTKYIAVTTDRDYKKDDLVLRGYEILEEVAKKGFTSLLAEHQQKWLKRWEIADVEIKGDDEAQQGIRFNLFQLFSTYYGEDTRLNIGPKGFTGEKYGGATYWDTEAYALPLYLSTTDQHIAKSLLLYRFNQLDGARQNAKKQGLKGALYPMVTFNGIECHNEWEITFEEIHRNSAIAYAIFNYVNYTGDKDYLQQTGIDVLIEITRFWADRVHFNKNKNIYMIHGVTGPNEYENNINNNWYTNLMAKWTINYTIESLSYVSNEKKQSLKITKKEMSMWKDISEKMYLPYDEELDVFVQHDTFLDKDLMTVEELSETDRPLNQNWSWDKILRSCFIKQADVLQGIYFLNDQFTMDEKRKNFDFYEPMTVHESSLSPSVHSVLAAELGMEEKAYEMYNRTARLDLDNYNNDTEDGLHITSMTGSWLSIVQGFAGMRTFNEQLSFHPFTPEAWDGYTFNIVYRDHFLTISVGRDQVIISQNGPQLRIKVYGEMKEIDEDGSIAVQVPNLKGVY
ncbi:glycoside hydrolase family 65 protein [Bacillus carboniphilus]|uniref:Glycoside hydrolase family 65 protein n=1 Tax=Bacillus carboniphilus TaxID=86663 RepID=A0ABY9K0L7_9BACI|nr:glycoside hydrolase family 65 protein [Bacillus carboniphilus]WLR43441.1 glycoside hydrolase family 65 protein [Bacillus carboniphilus]